MQGAVHQFIPIWFSSEGTTVLTLYSATSRNHLIFIQMLIITAFDELKDLVWELGKETGLDLHLTDPMK